MLYLLILIVVVGLIGGYLTLQRSKSNLSRSFDMVFFKILIPRKESEKDKQETTSGQTSEGFKEAIGVMDHFFTNLHSIYKGGMGALIRGREHIALEYVYLDEQVGFYMVAPRKLANLLEKQVTSFYPEAIFEQTEDYNLFLPDSQQSSAYLTFSKSYGYPLKTFKTIESDPINSIVNSLSKLGKDETAAIQFLIRPEKSGWQKKCKNIASSLQGGKSQRSFSLNPIKILGLLLDIFQQGLDDKKQPEANKPTPLIDEAIKALGEKSNSQGYEAVIRIVTSAPTREIATNNLTIIKSSFTQFAGPDINGLKSVKHHSNRACLTNFILRSFRKSIPEYWKGKMILSTTEIASMFHLPNTKFNKIAAIQWQNYKIAPPPPSVPKEGLLLGHNIYRGVKTPIYMMREDRFRHFYVIGQTGTGKSSMLITMVKQDLQNSDGFAVMDPHGQLADDLFPFIPRERADDIIYFNPADVERPMGLNLLEAQNEEERDLVALDAMNMMIKLFGNEVFGPRIQDYFRNGCLTLMADPEGGALTDIVRLFTDDTFQQYKVTKVANPIVKSFWEKQMASTGQREKQEMIPYFAAKFGQFTTNSLMRNIIGQVKSAFQISEVMDTGKILLINLSKGLIGDINSNLLGMIIVSKVQTAALRRQRVDAKLRKDFFFYIDEFQNFVTDSIESILSEARKYRLSLNIAHQYLGQLEKSDSLSKSSTNLKNAIFGNVGTIMSYKVGAADAEYLEKEFTPVFSQQDLVNIDARKAVMKLSINTQPSRPFSLIPQNPNAGNKDYEVVEAFKQLARLKYGRDRDFVSREIFHRIGVAG